MERADHYQRPEYTELQGRLAVWFWRLRTARGWSQQQVADACGITKQVIQRIEAAGTNVTFAPLARLAAGLGLDPAELVAPVDVPEMLRDPDRPGRIDRVR